jgi:prepilin-type N-terminal cleavage/methylation domain-containing protein
MHRKTNGNQKDRRAHHGVSLLELLAVVTLIGIFSSVVVMRYGRTLFGDFGSQSVARQLSLDLLTCQRAAIRTGDDHFLEFTLGGTRAVSYRLMRDTGMATVLVDGPRTFATDVVVTVSQDRMRYNFEGAAAANYSITLVGQNRSTRIDVIPINGTIRVTES